MAIRHMISGPVTILTPTRNGRVWIRYESGRMAETDVTELIADGGSPERNRAIEEVTANWKWTDEWQTPNWHRQGTARLDPA
jgi:hypothetical protein